MPSAPATADMRDAAASTRQQNEGGRHQVGELQDAPAAGESTARDHPALAKVRAMDRIVSALRSGRLPHPDDWSPVAEAWDWYREHAHRGADFLQGLGVTPADGECGWWAVERRARRDALIRRVAGDRWPNARPATQARLLAAALHRARGVAATLDGDLAQLISLGGDLSVERLRKILVIRSGCS